ncbi:undecaprenyl-diphosphate phosphatase [bacterium]|nr:undecaprenyl-diphosphate phosphatase [bacterium]NCQ55649.1 undecaprenyl-diphosphate phosphatase [Candidatus Parcubacteria bacterium]NCS67474.1 undecaprenyl-diphosphate phosphatase [Candidatus Peregrinibacteria bacterium]NCS96200.1 undecaprenyl-diphosphate phosphatase [bacterium]
MEIWQSLILGMVQGVTEFFPVSSSGHLFLAEVWLGLVPDINFTILLHVASLLAVILVYRQEVWNLIKSGFDIKALQAQKLAPDGVLAWQLVLATVFTVGVALLIEPYFETLLSLKWVAGTLIITGLLILIAEKFRRSKEINFSWGLAITLGLVQGLAVVPGISRSGLTIAFLILIGLNRQLAVKLSFLLSIPTILGALVFMLKDEWGSLSFTAATLIGFVASFLTAWLAIYTMKSLVEKRWIWFAPYCLLLGGGILLWTLKF